MLSQGLSRKVESAAASITLAIALDVEMTIFDFRHRRPTHTVWFAAVVGVAGLIFGTLVGSVAVLSHLAADALPPGRIPPSAVR